VYVLGGCAGSGECGTKLSYLKGIYLGRGNDFVWGGKALISWEGRE